LEQRLILDRYRPLADLGEGGHAWVTLAWDTRIGRRVAIKRLPLPLDARGTPRRTGLAEARTAAMLAHTAIVAVYDWETDADEAFLITEFVEGASLADVLRRLGRLDTDEAAAVLGPVARALAFAHDNGVLHLDVKPENVLLTREGDVKVADFGISALTGLSGTASVEEGTLGFMPPEQLRGEKLDARTDEWALASLMFEALTGANPFDADTVELAIFRAAEAPVPGPSDLLRDVTPGVDDPLLTALAPDPRERYAGVAEFAAALLAELGDPAAGTEALASAVRELTAEDAEREDEEYTRLGAWDRLASLSPAATRVGGAIVAGWLAYAGLAPWHAGGLASGVATALVAVAGGAAPALGLALGLLALVAGAARVSALAAVALLAAGAGLWLTLGRRGRGDALLAIAAPGFAVARVAGAVPLLLGFAFEPLEAAGAAAFAALTVMVASALSGSAAPLLSVAPGMLIDPWVTHGARFSAFAGAGPYVVAASWAGAAALMSVMCRRGSRLAALGGVLVGTTAMYGGYAAWALVAGAGFLPATAALQQLAASLILMAVVIALGAPVRGALDDFPADQEAGDSL
jgi:eukaryotic-like serine/threonine-protein kinase